MKESSKKTGQTRKPVQYRARHKKLRDLREEDTKHGFQERIKVSQSHAAEPVFCGVWRGGETESIELTTSNYRIAPTKLEDNVRASRPPTSGDSVRASTSPSSSTYSSDLALLEDLMDSPYGRTFLQLAPTEESLSEQGYYPPALGSAVTGGHPLPTLAMQHIHLPIEENLNIAVSGYTGYGNVTYVNQVRAAVNTQVPLVPPNLSPYDYYPENQYLTQGPDLRSNQATSSSWELEPNYIWNSSMVERSLYGQVSNAPNITQQYSGFGFSQVDDNQYIPNPNLNQPNIVAQHGYYSGP